MSELEWHRVSVISFILLPLAETETNRLKVDFLAGGWTSDEDFTSLKDLWEKASLRETDRHTQTERHTGQYAGAFFYRSKAKKYVSKKLEAKLNKKY